jgi:hypothetical protein
MLEPHPFRLFRRDLPWITLRLRAIRHRPNRLRAIRHRPNRLRSNRLRSNRLRSNRLR